MYYIDLPEQAQFFKDSQVYQANLIFLGVKAPLQIVKLVNRSWTISLVKSAIQIKFIYL